MSVTTVHWPVKSDNCLFVCVSADDSDLPLLFLRYLLETFCIQEVTLPADQSQSVIFVVNFANIICS